MASSIFDHIKSEIEKAPRNSYVAELHLQVIKFHEELADLNGREFCEKMGLAPAWGTEFTKMKKIASRLVNAGLDLKRI